MILGLSRLSFHFGLADIPNSNGTISESTKESCSLGVPFKTRAFLVMSCLGVLTLGKVLSGLVLERGKWLLGWLLEIPDLDAFISGGSKPLVRGIELQIVDLGLRLERNRWLLEIINIPNQNQLIFSSGCNVLSSRRDRKRVDSSIVGLEGVLNLEVLVPDLEEAVPANSSEVLELL